MLGKNHALVGLGGWLIAGPSVGSLTGTPIGPEELALGAVICMGAAVLPDFDEPNAQAARTFGTAGRVTSTAVKVAAGGHRQRTHSLVFVAAVAFGMTVLVSLANPWPAAVAAGICTAWGIALATKTVRLHVHPVVPIVVGAGTAYGLVEAAQIGPWVAVAVWFGCLLHLAGDVITPGGVPLFLPVSKYRVRVPVMTVGGPLERVVSVGLFVGCLALIGTHWSPSLPV